MFRKGLHYLPEPYRAVVARLLDVLLGMFNDKLVSVVVYGSVARGDFRRDSDIDLLLVIEDLPRSRLERARIFIRAEEKLDQLLNQLLESGYAISISPVIKTPREASRFTPLYLDMVEDAVIVYDRGGFFENILRKLREKLRELGAERVWVGRRWYWRLKRNYRFGEEILIE